MKIKLVKLEKCIGCKWHKRIENMLDKTFVACLKCARIGLITTEINNRLYVIGCPNQVEKLHEKIQAQKDANKNLFKGKQGSVSSNWQPIELIRHVLTQPRDKEMFAAGGIVESAEDAEVIKNLSKEIMIPPHHLTQAFMTGELVKVYNPSYPPIALDQFDSEEIWQDFLGNEQAEIMIDRKEEEDGS